MLTDSITLLFCVCYVLLRYDSAYDSDGGQWGAGEGGQWGGDDGQWGGEANWGSGGGGDDAWVE